MSGDEKPGNRNFIAKVLDFFSGNRRKYEAASLKRESDKAEYDWFCEHFKYLRDTEHEARKNLDQAILTVSGLLLASSLTFVQFLQVVRRVELLSSGWILLIIALCATLLSMWISTMLFERAYSQWLEDYDKANEEIVAEGADFGMYLLNALNLISILSLVAGIIILCIFSCKEMQYKRLDLANKTKEALRHDKSIERKEDPKDHPGQRNEASPPSAKTAKETSR